MDQSGSGLLNEVTAGHEIESEAELCKEGESVHRVTPSTDNGLSLVFDLSYGALATSLPGLISD